MSERSRCCWVVVSGCSPDMDHSGMPFKQYVVAVWETCRPFSAGRDRIVRTSVQETGDSDRLPPAPDPPRIDYLFIAHDVELVELRHRQAGVIWQDPHDRSNG